MKAPAPRTVTISERIAALTGRERAFVLVGAACLALFLLYLLLWRGSTDDGPVELASPSPPASMPTPPPVLPASPPPALPVVTAPPSPVAASPAMVLQGVSGGGPGGGAALIQHGDGRQRLVRVGREIAPGTVLKSVGLTWAIASTAGGDVRFDLNRPGMTAVSAAALPSPATVPQASPAPLAEQRETTDLRLGLQPVSPGGRRGGYLVRAGAHMPRLARAGLRPGDIIVRVNGSTLDEERLLELSWQMTNAPRTEFEVIRDGKPLKLTFASTQPR